jgi:hypothetical protein
MARGFDNALVSLLRNIRGLRSISQPTPRADMDTSCKIRRIFRFQSTYISISTKHTLHGILSHPIHTSTGPFEDNPPPFNSWLAWLGREGCKIAD